MNVYENRREKMYDWMARESIGLLMLEDTEGRRDPAIRYLAGQPGDALLFLSVDKRSILVPWDINIAKTMADADNLVPYTEFERHPINAARSVADYVKIPQGSRFEIPTVTSYPSFLKYVENLTDFDVICRNGGAADEIIALRSIKDEEEILIYREAAAITNEVIGLLEKEFDSNTFKTEADVALFIEAEARSRGCEGTGFETLAAGPKRSFGIHAVPPYSSNVFGTEGLSILDFGLKYKGYTTDVTITLARGTLSRTQNRMLNLVEKAYDQALAMVAADVPTRDVALATDAFFGKAKKTMPHALGHGIGLEAHEAPAIRSRSDNDWRLEHGMVFTLEPGLYDPNHGGCRLENDILLTENGVEVLTQARMIRL
ncbi:Xaa-Pro dipeptidase [Treponema sp.]